MHKRIITFVRHSKSSWKDFSLRDIDRPLNKRGKRDCVAMSEIYAKEFSHPEIILSSTSKRTRLSLKPFAKALNIKKENIFFESSLYHASTDDIESVIFQQDPEVKSLMMFGHNPGYTEMANDYSSAYIENVPTTGIFTLEGESKDWKEFLKNCKLTRFIYPKMYV